MDSLGQHQPAWATLQALSHLHPGAHTPNTCQALRLPHPALVGRLLPSPDLQRSPLLQRVAVAFPQLPSAFYTHWPLVSLLTLCPPESCEDGTLVILTAHELIFVVPLALEGPALPCDLPLQPSHHYSCELDHGNSRSLSFPNPSLNAASCPHLAPSSHFCNHQRPRYKPPPVHYFYWV